jgi:hypothetical protein
VTRTLALNVACLAPDIVVMFGFSLDRLAARRSSSAFGTSSRLREEVKPPSLGVAEVSGWQRVRDWVSASVSADAGGQCRPLPTARADFLDCLSDTRSEEARKLALRVERACSLRELWHLRASLFGCLAREFSQAEAYKRLRRVSRHFGTRCP